MRGPADQGPGPDDFASHRRREVVLAQMQYLGAGCAGDVGTVVDRQQRTVPSGGIGQHLQRGELTACLQLAEAKLAGRSLVPQLDDVHPAGQGGVGKRCKILALAAGIGAQIQPGPEQPGAGFVHTATVAANVDVLTRESQERG